MTYVQPGLLVILALLAATFRVSDPRRKNRLILISIGALFLWSFGPAAWLFAFTLEAGQARIVSLPQADAIVVLGSGARIETLADGEPEVVLNDSSTGRLEEAVRLFHSGLKLPVIVASGPILDRGRSISLSGAMARFLRQRGIPADLVLEESRSQSTFENAVYSAEILHRHGWKRVVLVTEAIHIPRAKAVFRRQGFDILPSPCCFITAEFPSDWTDFVPKAGNILVNEHVLHEWIGRFWYRLTRKA